MLGWMTFSGGEYARMDFVFLERPQSLLLMLLAAACRPFLLPPFLAFSSWDNDELLWPD